MPSQLRMIAVTAAAALALVSPGSSAAYISAPGILPAHVRDAYLTRVTREVLAVPPGQLTDDVLEEVAPRLMMAWATHRAEGGTTSTGTGGVGARRGKKKNNRGEKKDGKNGSDGVVSVPRKLAGANNIVATSFGKARQQRIPTRARQAGGEKKNKSTEMNDKSASSAPKTPPAPATAVCTKYECALAVEGLLKRLVDERHVAQRSEAGGGEGAPLASSSPTPSPTPLRASLTTDAYNAAITSWARAAAAGGKTGSGDGQSSDNDAIAMAERAEDILRIMHQLYESGEDVHVRPNHDSFKGCLWAWVNTRTLEGTRRAHAVLDWMVSLHHDDQVAGPKPDGECFDLVLRSWARHGAGERVAGLEAERVLRTMEGINCGRAVVGDDVDASHDATAAAGAAVGPRTESFNLVLAAWAKVGIAAAADGNRKMTLAAARRAEDILLHMERLSDDGGLAHVHPDEVSYSTVLQGWTRAGEAERATNVLNRMRYIYLGGAGPDVRPPDALCYNYVLASWAKSGDRDAPRRARAVLGDMRAMHAAGCEGCKPDVYSYTSVLGAYSNAGSRGGKMGVKARRQLFEGAMEVFLEAKELGVRPNHVTYGTLLRACAFLLPPRSNECDDVLRDIFAQCKRDRQVNDGILRQLKRTVSTLDVHEELTSRGTRQNREAVCINNSRDQKDKKGTKGA